MSKDTNNHYTVELWVCRRIKAHIHASDREEACEHLFD